MDQEDPETSETALARLDAIRAKRGYLLPHHGLMAISAPDMLTAYDAAYTALTLTPRRLNAHDKEFVWLAILIATDEALATHHIAKFRDAAGTDQEVEGAVRIAALGYGARAFDFVGDHWQDHLPGFDARRLRQEARKASLAGLNLSDRLVLMAEAATAACLAHWRDLAWTIEDAYGASVNELDLAEALSLTMFPGSVPRFVDACGVWRAVILAGKVNASPLFKSWAELTGQGGYDEASGKGGDAS
ncbi:MAG: carboxymuconolactone decarboxylase family protein [Pseudomonadota bacterium]